MLDDIKELRTFVNIVGAESLSAAARDMNLALSVVSKRLASLERRAEARLIARNTRRLALTEEGQNLYERAQRILAEVDEAEAVLTSGRVEPQGLLRVSAPVAFGRAHVSPVCRDLVSAHPKISIDLVLTDRMVDLIEEGIDVVVRIGPPKDSRLVLRKLIDDYRIVVGAPEYLERRGTPMTPADLEGHECVHYRGVGTHWRLVDAGGQAIEVRATSRLRSNSGQVAARLGTRKLRPCHEFLGGRGGRSAHRPSRPCSPGVAQRPRARVRAISLEPSLTDPRAAVYRRHGGFAEQASRRIS